MKTVRDIFESVDWWNLVPDQTILTGAVKGNAAARSAKGDWIIVYITSIDPVSLKLDMIKASSFKGYRIDPGVAKKRILELLILWQPILSPCRSAGKMQF